MKTFDFSERGNHSFRTEEGAAVIFGSTEVEGQYVQAAFSPRNYPSWDVSTIHLHGEDLQNHIMYNLADWIIDKCQVEINVTESDHGTVKDALEVIDDVVDHVINMSHSNDCDPSQTAGALVDAVEDSARALDYVLTQRMAAACCAKFNDEFEA